MNARPGIDFIGTAVTFFCWDGGSKIFLCKRSEKCRDEHGTWDPGAGQIEFGETPEEAVAREVEEEYGIRDMKIIQKLPAMSVLREMNGIKTHWISIPFIMLVDPSTVSISEPHKFSDSGWFSHKSFPQPFHTGTTQIINANWDILKKIIA